MWSDRQNRQHKKAIARQLSIDGKHQRQHDDARHHIDTLAIWLVKVIERVGIADKRVIVLPTGCVHES